MVLGLVVLAMSLAMFKVALMHLPRDTAAHVPTTLLVLLSVTSITTTHILSVLFLSMRHTYILTAKFVPTLFPSSFTSHQLFVMDFPKPIRNLLVILLQ
jgi:hypothetical protein